MTDDRAGLRINACALAWFVVAYWDGGFSARLAEPHFETEAACLDYLATMSRPQDAVSVTCQLAAYDGDG